MGLRVGANAKMAVLFSCALLGWAGDASALSELSVYPDSPGYYVQTTDFPITTTIEVPGFDPALGRLEEVYLYLPAAVGGSVTFEAAETGQYWFSLAYKTILLSDTGAVIFDTFGWVGGHQITVREPGTYSASEGNEMSQGVTLTENLDWFLETRTYTLEAYILGKINGPEYDEQFVDLDSTSSHGGVIRRVMYSYEPVPEPSTALLVGLGLTGLAASKRR